MAITGGPISSCFTNEVPPVLVRPGGGTGIARRSTCQTHETATPISPEKRPSIKELPKTLTR